MDNIYKPSKWGTEYHNLPHREAFGAGSAGPGKSLVLLMDPMYQAISEHERCADPAHPNHMAWGRSKGWALHLRRSMPMLAQTIARSKDMFPLIDPGATYNTNDTMWVFSSGYKHQFGHCRDSGGWDQYMSGEYSHISFDELTQFEEEQYDQITGRLRSSDDILRASLKVRSMSNPMMRNSDSFKITMNNPHWVRERFVEPAPDGRVTFSRRVELSDGTTEKRSWIFLPAKLSDNPDKKFVRDYEATLKLKPPHIRKALLEGDWFVTPGSFYGDSWINSIHICRPFKIPMDWPQFRSMDWGFKSHGCVHWWGMDPDGNCFVQREYTFIGKRDIEVALEIKRIEQGLGLWARGRSLITGPADTQLWEDRGDTGKSKAAAMSEIGVNWVKASKSRARNAERFLTRLQDHQNETTTPGIVFFNTCTEALKTIPSIPTNPAYPEEPADGGYDHHHDSVLYGCAYASNGSRSIARPRTEEEKLWDQPAEDKSRVSRGRYGYGSNLL